MVSGGLSLKGAEKLIRSNAAYYITIVRISQNEIAGGVQGPMSKVQDLEVKEGFLICGFC